MHLFVIVRTTHELGTKLQLSTALHTNLRSRSASTAHVTVLNRLLNK